MKTTDMKNGLLIEKISKYRILPVIAIENAEDAVPLCTALSEGGLKVAEITFRTAAAEEAIRIVASEFPEFVLGAGTITKVEELVAARNAGAGFAVAPGCNPVIVKKAQELDMPFFPGVATPGEVERAMDCGCRILKFFPAGAMGGLNTLKSIYAVYRHREIQFIPTGGVTADNVKEYLDFPGVLAVGGTWIASSSLIENRQWSEVSRLTAEALQRLSL